MPRYKITPSDFQMHSGDGKRLNITVLDENDAAVDISGATITLAVARRVGGTPQFTAVGTVVSGPAGTCYVDIAPADTASLHGAWRYEVQLTDALSKPSTIVYGTILILRDTVV